MFDMIIGLLVGLLVGWNILPQPNWMKEKYEWAVRRLHEMVSKAP